MVCNPSCYTEVRILLNLRLVSCRPIVVRRATSFLSGLLLLLELLILLADDGLRLGLRLLSLRGLLILTLSVTVTKMSRIPGIVCF